ncbi:Uncharacterised protein [Serratia fonticola]|uniref:Cysteine synthase n=1 Tax=Serratia fonticola TaxID=47917 RepID=A0A4U9U4L8_SERFO|nr:Uncharacterised protein [Serratia fonticola]
MTNAWVKYAIGEIEADFQRSADTHLIRLNLPEFPGIYLYLKDESTHPTGSLKHRLRVRCSFMGCVTVGSTRTRRLLKPLRAARRYLKPILPACSACRLSR